MCSEGYFGVCGERARPVRLGWKGAVRMEELGFRMVAALKVKAARTRRSPYCCCDLKTQGIARPAGFETYLRYSMDWTKAFSAMRVGLPSGVSSVMTRPLE